MFHEKEITLYQSITAPDSLKQRVVNTSKKPAPRPWYAKRIPLVTSVASLVILLSAVYLMTLSSPNMVLLAEGNKIGTTPMELSYHSPAAKANNLYMDDNSFFTMLKIDVTGNTTITVSGGTIYDTENSNYAGKSITVAKDTSLCWTVDNETKSDSFLLTANYGHTTNTYILEKNKKTGIWMISQQ